MVGDVEEDAEQVYSVYKVAGDRIQSQHDTVTLHVENRKLNLLLDSGSKVSILNLDLFNRLFKGRFVLGGTLRKLKTYTGSKIVVTGEVLLPIKYKKFDIPYFPFTVVKEGSSIMGRDLMEALRFQIVDDDGVAVNEIQHSDLSCLPEQYKVLTRGLGKVKGFVHKPKVDDSVKPVSQPLRKQPLALQDQIKEEIQKLKENDIIEPVQSSPWVSNLVVVNKPDGNIRLCCDMREPNKAIIPDRYPLPSFEQLSSTFSGSRIFSKIDLNSAYWQLALHEDSRDLTCFITSEGLFRYKRVCFGMSSAPGAFQRFISNLISGVKGTIGNLDDIVIHAATREEHDRRLFQLLDLLVQHNITITRRRLYLHDPQSRLSVMRYLQMESSRCSQTWQLWRIYLHHRMRRR